MSKRAKILIVDDQRLARRTLRSLLRQQRHWEIYEAPNGKAALKLTGKIKPDVIVLDIRMPS